VSSPRCRASRCLEGLADRLLGGGAPPGGVGRSFWERMSRGRQRKP